MDRPELEFRREFLRMAGLGMAGSAAMLVPTQLGGQAGVDPGVRKPGVGTRGRAIYYDVRAYGAKGDGTTLDTAAVNAAIDAAADAGGGTVIFTPGVYACYSIHLKSNVALYLQQGATILAAPTPMEGFITGGYDAAEPQGAWDPYQDYGHNHWHNSLIWGEDLHDFGIFGPGLIYGRGLSRGFEDKALPDTTKPGVGNKSISLKNCRNVILSDFSILQGGWFGILATGVDNLTIDNLKIDTNRDGMDIDCCRNVRISNCTVNSPWDDAICPKSSYALGQSRMTENVTIANCFVTGGYALGSVLDGTWRPVGEVWGRNTGTGRIKLGTESNGGFRNVAITNCIFEACQGFALESEDGAIVEDITFTGVTMRNIGTAPIFLRLGSRLRGPKPETVVGSLKRVMISNVTGSGASQLPSILAGVQGHPVEDIKISDVYLHQHGGADAAMAALHPLEDAEKYPDPRMFGDLPATGFYARHAKNIEFTNVEIATEHEDARPALHMEDVDGVDFFRIKFPGRKTAGQFQLKSVKDFRVFGCKHYADASTGFVDDEIV